MYREQAATTHKYSPKRNKHRPRAGVAAVEVVASHDKQAWGQQQKRVMYFLLRVDVLLGELGQQCRGADEGRRHNRRPVAAASPSPCSCPCPPSPGAGVLQVVARPAPLSTAARRVLLLRSLTGLGVHVFGEGQGILLLPDHGLVVAIQPHHAAHSLELGQQVPLQLLGLLQLQVKQHVQLLISLRHDRDIVMSMTTRMILKEVNVA